MSRPLGNHALTLWTRIPRGEILGRLADLDREKLDLDVAITHAVARARALGFTWEQIGIELNMSRQSAWQRWQHLDPPEGD